MNYDRINYLNISSDGEYSYVELIRDFKKYIQINDKIALL